MEYTTEIEQSGHIKYKRNLCVECGCEISPDWYDCPECGAETQEGYTEYICELGCEEKENRGRCIKYQQLVEYDKFFQTHTCWTEGEKPEYPCETCEFYGKIKHKGTLIKSSESVYNYGAAMEWGGTPYNWVETHKCWNCGTVFEFENSNY